MAVVVGLFVIQEVLISQTDQHGQNTPSTVISLVFEPPYLQPDHLIAQYTGGEEVFQSVQRGIVDGDIEELTRNFGRHIYLNIRSIESGYYSANQAQFVVQNFFNTNKILSFSFTTYGESGGAPYATGRGSINVKGNREYIQIYVSLMKQKDRWVISQFNIY